MRTQQIIVMLASDPGKRHTLHGGFRKRFWPQLSEEAPPDCVAWTWAHVLSASDASEDGLLLQTCRLLERLPGSKLQHKEKQWYWSHTRLVCLSKWSPYSLIRPPTHFLPGLPSPCCISGLLWPQTGWSVGSRENLSGVISNESLARKQNALNAQKMASWGSCLILLCSISFNNSWSHAPLSD